MNEIKQANMYLRVLWLGDNEILRPDNINIKLDGEVVEETTFSISQSDKNVGNNAPWKTTEWANGITYNYQKEPKIEENTDENDENSEIDEENNENVDIFPMVIPSIVNIPTNYRCNILKNAETEEYAYYTIKMTYVPSKRKKMAKSTTPSIVVNGTTIENVNFNGVELDKVVFNGTTVFEKANTFDKLILANSTLNEGTPDFSLTATTDEGMFETDDPIYGEGAKSQYFRGAVTNNYVKFAGFWWRIIRINGDKTIRLIYDGSTCHANGTNTNDSINVLNVKYNENYNNSSYMGWTYTIGKQRPDEQSIESNAKIQTEKWYMNNIGDNSNYDSKVVNEKFCNDRRVDNNFIWSTNGNFKYTSKIRIENNEPTLVCDKEDIYTLKVGLITVDEAMYAGGNGTNNASYYLQNGQPYWTMSPGTTNGQYNYLYFKEQYGGLVPGALNSGYIGLRLVINLQNNIEVTGTGTMEDPYVVVGAE